MVAPYTFQGFLGFQMNNVFCSILGTNMASRIYGKSCQAWPSWAQVGPSLTQVGPSWRLKCKPRCTSSHDVVPMRCCIAKWPNIALTWPENRPKMEAMGVRTLVFRSFFLLVGFVRPRGPMRGPRGPNRPPSMIKKKLEKVWG